MELEDITEDRLQDEVERLSKRVTLLERALFAALHNGEVGFEPQYDRGTVEMIERDDGSILMRRARKS